MTGQELYLGMCLIYIIGINILTYRFKKYSDLLFNDDSGKCIILTIIYIISVISLLIKLGFIIGLNWDNKLF